MEPWSHLPSAPPAPPAFPSNYPYGFNYLYNPLVGLPMPFPGGMPPFGTYPIHPGLGAMLHMPPPNPPQEDEDKGKSSSPKRHASGNKTEMDTADADDVAGRYARGSATGGLMQPGGSIPSSAANLAEILPSTNSLMSFSNGPLHAMRSLHSSVTALPMLDALAQGASLEFLQGMTSSMSAAMLQGGSPQHAANVDAHLCGNGAQEPNNTSYPPPPAPGDPPGLIRPKSSNMLNGQGSAGPLSPHLPIAPLTAAVPEPSQGARHPSRGPSRPAELPSGANGAGSDHLANNTMAQLQAFLNQSQAVMAPRPPQVKGDGSGSGGRKAQGSAAGGSGRQMGAPEAPGLRTASSTSGGRRGGGLGSSRSASQPQLQLSGSGTPLDTMRSGRGGMGSAGGAAGRGMSRISSLQALVEVAAAAAEDDGPAAANGSMPGTESADPDDMDDRLPGDEGEVKRLKRKQSNRESARRSRLKKQAEADALNRATSELQAENTALRAALTASQGLMNKLVQEKAGLIDQVRSLGHEVSCELDWAVPVIHMPPFCKSSGAGH